MLKRDVTVCVYIYIYLHITFIFFEFRGFSSLIDILENQKDQAFQRACNVEMS